MKDFEKELAVKIGQLIEIQDNVGEYLLMAISMFEASLRCTHDISVIMKAAFGNKNSKTAKKAASNIVKAVVKKVGKKVDPKAKVTKTKVIKKKGR
jgi:hypothetical protein